MNWHWLTSPLRGTSLQAHHRARLAGLEQLFGIQLTHEGMPTLDAQAMFLLFRSTAQSFLAIITPWSRFLEAGLLHRVLDRTGPHGQDVADLSDQISELAQQSCRAHLDLLDTILAILLADRADRTVTNEDLRRVGVDDAPPNPSDYTLYEG